MVKLIRVCALMFVISFVAIALVKVFVVLVVTLFYGGHYPWGISDVMFVVKQGTLMAVVFCTFAVLHYFRNR